MTRPQKRKSGYLVVVLVICLAAFMVPYLALSAYSAHHQDQVQLEQASVASFYAAESGLVRAEVRIKSKGFKVPPAGNWFEDDFSRSGSHFAVSVAEENYGPKGFTLISIGEMTGEHGKVVSTKFEARYTLNAKKIWVAEWRALQ